LHLSDSPTHEPKANHSLTLSLYQAAVTSGAYRRPVDGRPTSRPRRSRWAQPPEPSPQLLPSQGAATVQSMWKTVH